MYRSVLVPLDGTWYGEHALPIACGIARRTGAVLHLVHVHTEVAIPVAVESLPFLDTQVPIAPSDEQRAYLDGLAERLTTTGLHVTTGLLQGPLTESLSRYALDRDADLVVACTHCHEGLSRFWHRGVGEQILSDLGVPILLNRSDETEPDTAPEREFRHILVPLNGSRYAEEILERAVPLGRAMGARFTLLWSIRPLAMVNYTLLGQDAEINEFMLEQQQEEAVAYLERTAERLRGHGLDVEPRVVRADEPAEAIVEATRIHGSGEVPPVDLIAMTTHCRGPLSRAVLSSITDQVLHNAPVPLLLHHPQLRHAAAQPLLSRLATAGQAQGPA